MAEKSSLEEDVQELKKQCASIPEPGSGGEVIATVKKVMNTVFRTLKPQFQDEEMYSGSDVMQMLLSVIRVMYICLQIVL